MHRHTPLTPLYHQRGNNPSRLIGYRCQCGCDGIVTPAGNWSRPEIVKARKPWPRLSSPVPDPAVKNRAHARRVSALVVEDTPHIPVGRAVG